MNPEIPKFDPKNIEASVPKLPGRVVDTINPQTIDLQDQEQEQTYREFLSENYGPEGENWYLKPKDPSTFTDLDRENYLRGEAIAEVIVTELGDQYAIGHEG